LVFGFTGTTYLDSISSQIIVASQGFGSPALLVGIILMIAGFGFKIASVPFQMWVPDVYEGAPTPVTAYLSVVSKAVGFAVILRVFYTGFGGLIEDWAALFAILSAISMTIGNLIAIAQTNIKRLLAYSTIAHAGYLMVGLAAVSAQTSHGDGSLGPGTLLFYLAGYLVTNLAAFSAVVAVTNNTEDDRIESFAGIGQRSPIVAIVLAISLVSLTGIPPAVGFMAKLFIFSAALHSGLLWLVVLGLVNSVVSAYYYLRVVRVMYFVPTSQQEPISTTLPSRIALGITGIAVLVLGLWPQPLLDVAQRAASVLTP